jgi:hypothetical protein
VADCESGDVGKFFIALFFVSRLAISLSDIRLVRTQVGYSFPNIFWPSSGSRVNS